MSSSTDLVPDNAPPAAETSTPHLSLIAPLKEPPNDVPPSPEAVIELRVSFLDSYKLLATAKQNLMRARTPGERQVATNRLSQMLVSLSPVPSFD